AASPRSSSSTGRSSDSPNKCFDVRFWVFDGAPLAGRRFSDRKSRIENRKFPSLPMAKKIQGYIRLQLPAGAANPAPPVGPALGAQGVNIMAFCKEFNARTKDQAGMILPVVITVYSDKSFTFILKSPPASVLLKKAANVASGSAKSNLDKVGKVNRKQLAEIYKIKKADLHAKDEEAGIKIIAGTARNMGIEVVD